MKPNLWFLPLIIPLSTHAQIATDGTLGQAINLSGPDYQIGADLGQLRGGNLFHSFQEFNLNSFETATFSGPNHIQNVISRVTGGNPSNIDGLFRSTIPGADMYFLNPYGIMFGPNARLDVQGSFHASTADYLRLGEKGRFDARNPSDSLLTVAPIESFGFLTDLPAQITTQDSELSVPDNKTLSLIGGDLSLNGQLIFNESGEQQFDVTSYPIVPIILPKYSNQLLAPSGKINLISVAEKSEIKTTDFNIKGGKIAVHNTNINVNGEGGQIFIRGDQFEFHASQIENQNLSNQSPGIIDIQVDHFIMSGETNYAGIHAESKGLGQGSTIKIRTQEMTASNGFHINANSFNLGDTGVISIEADNISLSGQFIPELGVPSGIFAIVFSLNSDMTTKNQGSIDIKANNIKLIKGAEIGTITFGPKDGGDLNIKARDSLTISGALIEKAFGFEVASFPSGLISNSYSGSNLLENFGIEYSNNGNAGNIQIEAGRIDIKNGGLISSNSTRAKAGNISIRAEKLTLTDIEESALIESLSRQSTAITTSTLGTGSGGRIHIELSGELTISRHLQDSTPLPDLIKGANLLPGILTSSESELEGAGKAGVIFIQASHIKLNGHSLITTESKNGIGGNITIQTPHLLYLQEAEITTSVGTGKGDGGNITIENPTFVVLDKGQIKAQADAGHGGNIRIAAQHFIKSYESLVSASSRLGLDGDVEIDSPNKNVTEGMLTLSTETVDAGRMMRKPCKAMTSQSHNHRSQFIVQPLAGSPASPYNLQPSRLPQTTSIKQPQQSNRKIITHQPHSMIAATCKPSPAQIKTPVKKQERIIPEQLF